MTLSQMQPQQLKRERWLRRHKPLILITIFLLIVTTIAGAVILVTKPYITLALENGITLEFAKNILTSDEIPLRQSERRSNILILGIPGGDHEGKDLTDTMMIASISLADPTKSAFIAIPRDVWSPTLRDKINSAYHYGEEKRRGGGILLAKSTINEIVGIPIHYALVVDFSQFTNVIDILGGVDVTIDKSFEDEEFPIEGRENDLCNGDLSYRCRYKTIRFEKGIEHMDGKRALTFVRSRHADDLEGTDYARSNRQQALLTAFNTKLATKDVISNPEILRKLLSLYERTTDADLLLADLLYLTKLLSKYDSQQFAKINIPAQGKQREAADLLIVASEWQYKGRWVLVPRTGSFTEIHNFVACKLTLSTCQKL